MKRRNGDVGDVVGDSAAYGRAVLAEHEKNRSRRDRYSVVAEVSAMVKDAMERMANEDMMSSTVETVEATGSGVRALLRYSMDDVRIVKVSVIPRDDPLWALMDRLRLAVVGRERFVREKACLMLKAVARHEAAQMTRPSVSMPSGLEMLRERAEVERASKPGVAGKAGPRL